MKLTEKDKIQLKNMINGAKDHLDKFYKTSIENNDEDRESRDWCHKKIFMSDDYRWTVEVLIQKCWP